jgi:glycosidase
MLLRVYFSVGPKILIVAVYAVLVILLWLFVRRRIRTKPRSLLHPAWSRNAVIYEVNLRQYTPEGTFNAFRKHLPRLKKMGIDILWLMPVNPIGGKNRKGTLGSYYSVRDFLGINPDLGTLEDFKSLVAEAHSLGMKVLLDWIANHTSWDNNLIEEHPEWYQHDESGNIKSPVKEWTDAAGLDYEQEGIREYMTDALIYWIRETDIDGYRCDVAGMVPVSFWDEAVPKMRKVKQIFMLAEWETPEMHKVAFDATFSFEFYHLMNAIAKCEKSADKLDELWEQETAAYPPDAYRLRFTSNHDENSWNGSEHERMGEAAKAFAVLTFCIPGIPLIYSGQESAFTGRLKFFDKDQIRWDDFKLEEFYRTLIACKKRNPSLWNGTAGGGMIKVFSEDDRNIYAFTRNRGSNKVLAIFNLSRDEKEVSLKGGNYSGTYMDIFSGKELTLSEGSSLRLKAWDYLVLEKV